jgi:sec-independent protein translocase protein TatA
MGIENPVHLLFIAVVALLVLGPRRLPELARSLGRGIREFRESISDGSATGASHTPAPPSDPLAPTEAVVVASPPESATPQQVDPPEPVRSGDHASDRRPL